MPVSCIVRHFEHYHPLADADRDLLVSLEKPSRQYSRYETLWSEKDPARDFCTLISGWACSYRELDDGSRQVLEVFVPGDIIGLREYAFQKRLSGVMTLTPAELCPFPKKRLTEVFGKSQLLSNLFMIIATRGQALLLERLINLGRRSARQKMLHFIIEMYYRLKRTTPDLAPSIRLPLPQVVLGDTLGLSAVHVSRTFSELSEEGLITRTGQHVEMHDLKRLERIAGFDPAYLSVDDSTIIDKTVAPAIGG